MLILLVYWVDAHIPDDLDSCPNLWILGMRTDSTFRAPSSARWMAAPFPVQRTGEISLIYFQRQALGGASTSMI